MKRLNKILKYISEIGVPQPKTGKEDYRQVILVNRLCIILFGFVLIIIIQDLISFFDDYRHFRVPAQHIIFTAISTLVPLLLNFLHKYRLAKIFFAIFPVFFFLLYPVFFGFIKEEFYFWMPYAAIALSIIPHFIFSWTKERIYYIIPLIFCFIISTFTEEIFSFFSRKELPVESIVGQSMAFQKIARIAIFFFINLSIAYFMKLAYQKESLLKETNRKLQETNELILSQSDDLTVKNFRLVEQQKAIETQNKELQEQQDELNVQNEELQATLEQMRVMQQKLIQAEKMASIGVLTAGIAHEINNPINFISSGVEALKVVLKDFENNLEQYKTDSSGNASSPSEQPISMQEELGISEVTKIIDQLTENITVGVDRVAGIIKSLRVFSRLDRHEIAECNLNEFLESALLLLYHQYKNRIEIEKRMEDLPKVQCNPVQINQVFVNILINAIDAIERKGVIAVGTRYLKSTKEVEIRIRDNGEGIPAELLPRIFEPFFTTKDVGKGTGLGLAITYGIIENHKGQIHVESEPGKGTEFRIILPVSQD